MGEHADDVLNGLVCFSCGEWRDDVINGADGPGWPRLCEACSPRATHSRAAMANRLEKGELHNCPICFKARFRSLAAVRDHQRDKHGVNFKCTSNGGTENV